MQFSRRDLRPSDEWGTLASAFKSIKRDNGHVSILPAEVDAGFQLFQKTKTKIIKEQEKREKEAILKKKPEKKKEQPQKRQQSKRKTARRTKSAKSVKRGKPQARA